MAGKHYGWRARIGLMTPTINTVSERDLNRYLPEGVSLHAARMPIPSPVNVDAVATMNEDVDRAANALAPTDPDVIAYGVTAGSFFQGEGYDIELEDRIEAETDVPAVATAASARRALDTLGVDSIAVACPYIGELSDLLADFLEAYGFEVTAVMGEEFESSDSYGTTTPQGVYRRVREVDSAEADGVFISGMEYQGAPVVERLEADLDKPVVTAHQATLWDALCTAGVDTADIPLGSLMTA